MDQDYRHLNQAPAILSFAAGFLLASSLLSPSLRFPLAPVTLSPTSPTSSNAAESPPASPAASSSSAPPSTSAFPSSSCLAPPSSPTTSPAPLKPPDGDQHDTVPSSEEDVMLLSTWAEIREAMCCHGFEAHLKALFDGADAEVAEKIRGGQWAQDAFNDWQFEKNLEALQAEALEEEIPMIPIPNIMVDLDDDDSDEEEEEEEEEDEYVSEDLEEMNDELEDIKVKDEHEQDYDERLSSPESSSPITFPSPLESGGRIRPKRLFADMIPRARSYSDSSASPEPETNPFWLKSRVIPEMDTASPSSPTILREGGLKKSRKGKEKRVRWSEDLEEVREIQRTKRRK